MCRPVGGDAVPLGWAWLGAARRGTAGLGRAFAVAAEAVMTRLDDPDVIAELRALLAAAARADSDTELWTVLGA